MKQSKATTRVLWLTTLISGFVFAISFFGLQYKKVGGEPNFALYHFVHDFSIALEFALTISGAIGSSAVITLIVLAIVQRRKPKPVQEFNQLNKFKRIRKFSLLIAAFPGFVLAPFFLALALYAIGFRDQLTGLITGALTIITMSSIMPGIGVMITFLVFAIITATKKPIDPQTPIPKAQLTQIVLAAITSAMPAIAFVAIFLSAFDECVNNCFIFSSPVAQTAGALYIFLWLAQAAIWLVNRNKLSE